MLSFAVTGLVADGAGRGIKIDIWLGGDRFENDQFTILSEQS